MTAKKKMTGREAILQCAAYLEEQSWCVDFSGVRPKVLHARSNRSLSTEALPYKFWDWVRTHNVELPKQDAALEGLASEIFARLPHIYGSSFRPVENKFIELDGLTVANTYVPFRPEPRDDATGNTLVEELFARLFPDTAERTIVRQFLAHIVQKPLERPQWGLLITGVGGTGKSRLVELVEAALGNKHRWRENSYKPIDRQFSEVLPDNLIVTFDDAPASGQTYEALKHAITRSFQEVEIKGEQKKISREVYARIVVLSNSEDPLPGIADDRRFLVPKRCLHQKDREDTENFFGQFNDWFIQDHVPSFLFHYFSQVDLAGFNPSKTVRTRTLLQLEGISDPDQLADVVREVAAELEIFHHLEVVDHLERRGIRTSNQALSKALAEVGFVERRRTHPCPHKRRQKRQLELWCPSRSKRTPPLTEDQRTRILKALADRT